MSEPTRDEFRELCYQIGAALLTWQAVEEQHFKLFVKLLETPDLNAAAVSYFSNESFNTRHKMVHLMTRTHQIPDALLLEWNDGKTGLNKLIKEANLDRNRLAHYTHVNDYLFLRVEKDGTRGIERRINRLQSSPFNIVNHLEGKTPNNPRDNLGINEIWNLSIQWGSLAVRLNGFQQRIPLPPQLEVHGLFLCSHQGQILGFHQSSRRSDQRDTSPSAQGQKGH